MNARRKGSRRVDAVVVRGAREHNLRGVDVEIPRDAFTVVTGVSGSGKSSLAFDTVCKEGQRRFLESLSAYARQFLGGLEKPRVDHVEGLSPTVAIDQKTVGRNPRSTVGTVTEIHDHLRLLYARLGTPSCPKCGEPVTEKTVDAITDRLLTLAEGKRVMILAPLVRDRRGAYRKELDDLRREGFVRARIDGEVRRLEGIDRLDRYKSHSIELIQDRLRPSADKRGRLAEAVERAAERGGDAVMALIEGEPVTFSRRRACIGCGIDLSEMEPRLFSFNSPHGACPECTGLGVVRGVDESLLVPDPGKSLADGALSNLVPSGWLTYCSLKLHNLGAICKLNDVPFDRPWRELTAKQKKVVLYGTGGRTYEMSHSWEGATFAFKREQVKAFIGVIPCIEAAYRETSSRNIEKRYLSEVRCRACDGTRLRPEARAVSFRDLSLPDLSAKSVADLGAFFAALELDAREAEIGRDLFPELRARLAFLDAVGLGYLSLDRSTVTLAGGESQRIHLASQLGAGLRGVLYVLDEPSIGLHPRDNGRLLGALARLRDIGNTVVVVEHDEETMRAADHLVDLGPGAGVHGGALVAEGTVDQVAAVADSITGQFLSGARTIALPVKRRAVDPARQLVVCGAAEHNLKEIDVAFPLGCLTAVTGVSGSGKSTLVNLILKRALARRFHRAGATPGRHRVIEGIDQLDKVIEISQTPIGRTPRSNPATYTKVLGPVRDLFAAVPEARARGYSPGRFSFNVKGGRCETCKGAGVTTVEMQFLADVEVTCDDCLGRRFNHETLEIHYNAKAVDEVLALTVEEARAFFADIPAIARTLDALLSVGLDYVQLGQSTTTLSGGEAQRIKLASELRRPATGRTLYVLDEPTTGLHHNEVERLIDALQRLVDAGNSVVVIEHNLEVVKVADHLIDLGPEGGDGGGRVVAAGTPESVAADDASHTGVALRPLLGTRSAPVRSNGARRVAADAETSIRIRGARCHNLKGVDVDIPLGALTVVTGRSGSGKTSLAFDTLFAEGQRRFVESLSTYARRFLGRLDRAPVDRIDGLGPAIAIDQRVASRSPRSTVATATEVHDYLRLLFARAGHLHSPVSDRKLESWSPTTLARRMIRKHPGKRAQVLWPLRLPVADRDVKPPGKKDRDRLRRDLKQAGFVRLRVGDDPVDLRKSEIPAWPETAPVFVVVDRIVLNGKTRGRFVEAVETAFSRGHGRAGVWVEGEGVSLHAAVPACLEDGVMVEDPLSPRHFSFNSHVGACPECDGLGLTIQADPGLVIVDPSRPLFDGGLHEVVMKHLNRTAGLGRAVLEAAVREAGDDASRSWNSLSKQARDVAFNGTGERRVKMTHTWKSGNKRSELVWNTPWRGVLRSLERTARKRAEDEDQAVGFEAVMVRATCPECRGARLNPVSRHTRVGGRRIGAVLGLSVAEARTFLTGWRPPRADAPVAEPIVEEILHRLAFLEHVGLGYLTLDRASSTLSGGEAQRIRLATQIGNKLTGVNYVLDEPTIGLHPRDTDQLIGTLHGLRDLGNTVVVVEHDEAVMWAADHLIEMGPGAGARGGEVVAVGTPSALSRTKGSPTGARLRRRGKRTGKRKAPARRAPRGQIRIRGADLHNLKDVDVDIPLGVLAVVTGVSGSGKSTLVMEVLADGWRACEGAETVARVVLVDSAPIGVTPASNPATYTGLFTPIREFFATLPESKVRGYKPGRFSFNTGAGRCEACDGRGAQRVEMHFLSDIWITCDACGGKRYNTATLSVEFKGRTIADILETEVAEARVLFRDFPRICRPLEFLDAVGLGYLPLGQPANTLSGGEAQRVKLASELARRGAGDTLYLLDEPTVGLHGDEVEVLTSVLNDLVDRGHSVVVIEHHVQMMRAADRIIDLGPEGGEGGGRVVATGTPEEIAAHPTSRTAPYLR